MKLRGALAVHNIRFSKFSTLSRLDSQSELSNHWPSLCSGVIKLLKFALLDPRKMSQTQAIKPLRVCVIGAGAAGLIAIRHIKDDPDLTGCVFEQTDSIGGVWKYTDKIGTDQFGLPIHSTAYQGATFTTKVISVEPSSLTKGLQGWTVRTENLQLKLTSEHHFDAVVVCNGHYTKPLIPDIRNLNLFKGDILHSRDYRTPEVFKGKRVVVLGAGPSAVDISLELLQVASKVTLSCKNLVFKTSEEIEIHPPVVAANTATVITESGTELECDALLLCTGYKYDFPFLTPKCGVQVDTGKYVYPLYRQIVNARMTSMVFIGIPFGVCPFPQFDLQVRYSLKIFKGEIRLPPEEEMICEIKEMEADRRTQDIPLSHSHKLAERQWAYNKLLAIDIGDVELIKPVVQKIYEKAGMRRIRDSVNYKYDQVRILDNDTFDYTANANKPV